MTSARLKHWLVWVSGGALLVAMAVDTLAMIGRQVHLPLIGSIEIVQAAVLVASAGGLVVAAVDGVHARVHLLLDRLPPTWQAHIERLHAIAAALVYAALCAGSVWIMTDLWGGREESELLRIPYRPLRVAVAMTLLALVVLALRRAARRKS